MTKEAIKFTTPATTLKELVANGTDSDKANKIVAVASIIKAFTNNVKIDFDDRRGEVLFYMKNTTEEARFNNAVAYKVLLNLIDPEIKVGSLLWSDPETTGSHRDTIDVNFFGYMLDSNPFITGSKQVRMDEQASKQEREHARQGAEIILKMAAEKLKQAGNQDKVEAGEQTVECAFDDDE